MRLSSSASLLVIWPTAGDAAIALRCVDFADALAAGRLVMAFGDDLAAGVARLVESRRGWVVPTTLYLGGDAKEHLGDAATAILEFGQAALKSAVDRRVAQVQEAAAIAPSPSECIVLAADHSLRLHTDAGHALAGAFTQTPVRVVDTGSPAQASALALADACVGASAIVMADAVRGDLRGVVHEALPWVTWISRWRKPSQWTDGPNAVVLAEGSWRDAWLAAGWPAERIAVGGWPALQHRGAGRGALLAWDLPAATPPADVATYTSLVVLWEKVAQLLIADPFASAAAGGSQRLLANQAAACGVELDAAAMRRWSDLCVVPNIARGLAKLMQRRGIELAIAGSGWEEFDQSIGPIESREQLADLAVQAAVVIDPTEQGLPALAALGRPIVRARGNARAFLKQVRKPASVVVAPGALSTALMSMVERVVDRP